VPRSTTGRRARRILLLVLVCHVGLLLWLAADWHRARLLIFRVEEARTPAEADAPPERLAGLGYSQDRPEELAAFRPFASVALTSQDDLERLRILSDAIYLARIDRGPGQAMSGLQLTSLFAQMQSGRPGDCGSMSFLIAALARSLGYDTRQVIWFRPSGSRPHSGVEVYSPQYRTWVYYDANLNGYATDGSGQPLSLARLRELRRDGAPIRIRSNARLRAETEESFLGFLAAMPWHWYRLNNRLLDYEDDRRFGALNGWFGLLSRLPYPVDRLADTAFGTREARLVLAGTAGTGTVLGLRGLRWVVLYLVIVTAVSSVLIVMLALTARRARADFEEEDSGLPSSVRRSS